MSVIYVISSIGELSGPVELPPIPGMGIQLPSNAISLPEQLPPPAAGHAWSVVGDAVQQVPDNRGTVYSTDTGAEQQYTELGELPDGLTTEPRPSADHVWAGGEWVVDEALRAANRQAMLLSLCNSIDTTADRARLQVAGDPLRAVEYDRARLQAEQFAAADYQGDVPPMVAAWAINGRTAQEAADDILREAAQYTAALELLRTTRLAAKEQIRQLMADGKIEQAQLLADQTVATIESAVAGIGNNAAGG